MADIFLSHSSADNAAADQIKSWLERDRPTWSVFLDKHPRDGILAGQEWQDRLRAELQSCRLVMAIISDGWLASRWCFTEAVTATFRGKDFVAVVPSALPENSFEVAPPIVHERQRKPLDLETGAGWDEILYALDHSGLDPTEWFALPEGVGPYPGFVAFEERDAGVFFGRDQEITSYLEELILLKAPDRAQALIVSGGSGSGKSSLMKAGLIPRLRQQPDWVIIPPFDPSREPIHALFHVLRKAGESAGAAVDLPDRPPMSTDELTEVLQIACRAVEEATNAWLLLPLDQAEVLVAGSHVDGQNHASRLLDAVSQLLASRTRKTVALLTIRTEFLPALERSLPSGLRLKQMPLGPITALSDVIEKPAERFGIELEAGLAGKMVEDTRGGGALPLLAYTLRELNEKHGKDKKLTLEEYDELGGVEGAIEKKLHDALSDPEPTADEIAALRRTLVRHFVRIDEAAVEGERYLRAAVSRDLVPVEGRRVAERLEEARLIVGGDEDTLAIAHERLINNWPNLPIKEWLAEDRDDRKLIENLRSRLIEHQEGGPLLREKSLLDAKDLLFRDQALAMDDPELVSFINESVEADEADKRRQKLRFAGVLALAGVAILIAAGAVWFFLDAQNQAEIARAQTVKANEATEQAEEARDRALFRDSLFRAEQARMMIRQNRPVTGMQLALLGLPTDPRLSDRPWVGETAGALTEAMGAYREHQVLEGRESEVFAVASSADGTRIVSGFRDGTLMLWDASSGEQLQVLEGHDALVFDIALSADGARIVSGSSDGTVRLWDAASGEQLEILQDHDGDVPVVALSADGTRIVSGSRDGTVMLWDASSGERLQELEGREGGRVYAVALSADGTRIASGAEDSKVRLWDASSGERLQVLEGHESGVYTVALSADGARIASGSSDKTIRLWDALSGRQLQVLNGHGYHVNSVALSLEGTRVVSASKAEKEVRLWDALSGEQLQVLRGHKKGVRAVAMSADGAWAVSGSSDGTVRLWDMSSRGEQLQVLEERARAGQEWDVAVSADSARIVGVLSDGTVRLWDASSGTQLQVLKSHGLSWPLALSADGTRVASGSEAGSVRLWDALSGEPLQTLLGHKNFVSAVALSADGTRIVSGSRDGTVMLWNAASGERLQELEGREGGRVYAVALSADGTRIASGAEDSKVRLWDASSGERLQVLEGHEGTIVDVALSADGARIISGTEDSKILLWDASSGERLQVLEGHEASVRSVAFSNEGTRIVSGSLDGTVRLWDASSGEQLQVLQGRESRVSVVALSADGTRIVSGSIEVKDLTVRIMVRHAWVGRNKLELIERANARLPRELTEAEKRRFYVHGN